MNKNYNNKRERESERQADRSKRERERHGTYLEKRVWGGQKWRKLKVMKTET